MKLTEIRYRSFVACATQCKYVYSTIILMAVFFIGCTSKSDQTGITTVSIKGNRWLINGEPVLKGSPAEGLLVNVRMVNAVFEDSGPAAKENLGKDFDPDENTARFIAQIPDYYAHGVRGFTICLQGGLPGYEGAVNSAFNADGTLRKEYLDRVTKVIRAADREGAIIILSCFYQRQHSLPRALDGKAAIVNAVVNVATWIESEKFSNVVLEISNEYAHGGYNRWKDGAWLKSVEGQVELIRQAKAVAPTLLVSTSGMGRGLVPKPIAEAGDFLLLHFNMTPVNLIEERIKEARSYDKPVLCNEDDKVGAIGAEAARLSILSGAGWGFMHAKKNQNVPFEFDGAADDTLVYKMLQRLTTPGQSIDDIQTGLLSVVITEPIDGDVFASGKTIAIRAVVTGAEHRDGIEVHFFAGDTLIGKDASAPWEIAWTNTAAGKYYVRAVVQDSLGRQLQRSGPVDFEVRP
jgi:hypothetical protein